MGIIASIPNTNENGVSLVASFGVVRCAQRTIGSSSIHAPFSRSSFFLRLSFIILFAASTCCWAEDDWGAENNLWIPSSFYISLRAELSNCFPLSVTIECGTPNQQIMFLQIKFVHFALVNVESGSTSTHLVK